MRDRPELKVPNETVEEWQALVDAMAELAGIPAGLVMRLADDEIEVFVSSRTEGNPYSPGDREHFHDSGLYCERVIESRERLLVPNALADPEWEDNPDVKLNMISYLGYPILLPDERPFGTLCILDRRPNGYSGAVHRLVEKFRDLIQHHLELLYMNAVLGGQNRRFSDHLEELQALRGLVPICAWCKKIKDGTGRWQPVENYLAQHPDTHYNHGICPDCSDGMLS